MRPSDVAGLAAVVVLAPLLAAPAPPVPARLAHARYVALGYDLGDRVLLDSNAMNSPEVLSEERAAVQWLYDALEKWDQYEVVVKGSQADLVIAVRKGRLVSTGGGFGIGCPGRGGSASAGVAVSSPYDMLTVYEGTTILWRGTRPPGTPSSFASMFDDLRRDVEKAAPKKP